MRERGKAFDYESAPARARDSGLTAGPPHPLENKGARQAASPAGIGTIHTIIQRQTHCSRALKTVGWF